MTFDDVDYVTVLPQPVGEPPAEDEDSMHEAIEHYLQEHGLNFIAKDGPWPTLYAPLTRTTETHGLNSPNVNSITSARMCQLSPQHPPDSFDAAISSNVPLAEIACGASGTWRDSSAGCLLRLIHMMCVAMDVLAQSV